MNNLRTTLVIFAIVLITLCFSVNLAFAQPMKANYNSEPRIIKNGMEKFALPNLINAKLPDHCKINRANSTNSIVLTTLDSLQNAYSYYTTSQIPFVYDPENNILVTIKRGALDRDDPNVGDNSLDNLFILTSTDWGKTWSEPKLVFTASTNYGWARYPSVSVVKDPAEGLLYFYTAATTKVNASTTEWGWKGFANGVYFPDGSFYSQLIPNINIDGQEYRWGTDAAIAAGINDENHAYALAIGSLNIELATPPEKNNNIGLRTSNNDFEWEATIPSAWASDKYMTLYVDNASAASGYGETRTSSLQKAGGKYYMASTARFQTSEDTSMRTHGVSISSDHGKTWQDYDVVSQSLLKTYGSQNGYKFPDSLFYSTYSIDLKVMDNGDISISNLVFESLDADTHKDYLFNDRPKDLVEIYKESGVWGIRKIASHSVSYYHHWRYEDNTLKQANLASDEKTSMVPQSEWEMQLSKSVDGKYLVAKWIDIAEHDDGEGGKDSCNDVYMCVREIGNPTWGKVINVTNTNQQKKISWIPNYVPNNLKDIPILFMETQPLKEVSDQYPALWPMVVEYPQYVKIGYVDAAPSIFSVNDNNNQISISGVSVYPNPTSDMATVDFNLTKSANYKIEVFDVIGNKVLSLVDGFLSEGPRSMNINTKELSTGVYYISISANGVKETKSLNVIR